MAAPARPAQLLTPNELRDSFEDALCDFGADVAEGRCTSEQAEAAVLVGMLGDRMPSSLRGPLRAVREGTEMPGTARDVLDLAKRALWGDVA